MAQPNVDRSLQQAGARVRDAAGDAAREGWQGLQPLLDYKLLHIAGIDITIGGLIAAALVLVMFWLASALVRRALNRYGARNPNANAASLYTLSRLAYYVLMLLGVLLALDVAGIPIGKFTVFAGALGVGLGFGLQAIFNNFVSGLILLFDRSLKVGDFVELDANTRGTVHAIGIRATRITTNDNIDVLVPNSEFVSGRVVNWTHRSVNRRIRVPFGVAYGVDKELVKKAALEAAARVPFTLAIEGERRPQVWLTGFGDSAVEFALAVWLTEAAARRSAAIKAAYLWELDTALKAHGIEMPFPQRDLHLRSAFGLRGEQAQALLRGERGDASVSSVEVNKPTLPAYERAVLSGNDASEDAQRDIAEQQAVEQQAVEPAGPETTGADAPRKS